MQVSWWKLGKSKYPFFNSALFFYFSLTASFFTQSFDSALGQESESQAIKSSGKKKFWDRKTNIVTLEGNAVVQKGKEVLLADWVELNMNTRDLHAKGNCVFLSPSMSIHGEEMALNLDSRLGTILKGRVQSEQMSLTGRRIDRTGLRKFKARDGEYSTCFDCPQSWAFKSRMVDLEMEGYAKMKGVRFAVNDAPILWSPYFIVPVKTKRQTGFLRPRFGFQGDFTFKLPFFWAIHDSVDFTTSVGKNGQYGFRSENEFRYALTERSRMEAAVIYQRDKLYARSFSSFNRDWNRWSAKVGQTQELPLGIDQKFQLIDLSDNLYPFLFSGDLGLRGEPNLSSELSLSQSNSVLSGFILGKRTRNLLNISETDPGKFDYNTVQLLPAAQLSMNDRFLLESPFAFGFNMGVYNFKRLGVRFFDQDPQTVYRETKDSYVPGFDFVREARRIHLNPVLYSTLRPFDAISLVPSVQYRSFFYDFHDRIPDLERSYVLLQAEASTQLEKVWDTGNLEYPKIKHLIRPIIKYNLIPTFREDNTHPFMRQMSYAQTKYRLNGGGFDNYDLVPLRRDATTTNFDVPLGNSFVFGFSTQWIRREGKTPGASSYYRNIVEFRAEQGFDIKEYEKERPAPLTKLLSSLDFNFPILQSSTRYTYDHHAGGPKHSFNTGLRYTIDSAIHQNVLNFERNIRASYAWDLANNNTDQAQLGVTYSLSDYVMPSGEVFYNFTHNRVQRFSTALVLQSASRCWRMQFGLSKEQGQPHEYSVDFTLNFTGTGYSGVGDFGNQS